MTKTTLLQNYRRFFVICSKNNTVTPLPCLNNNDGFAQQKLPMIKTGQYFKKIGIRRHYSAHSGDQKRVIIGAMQKKASDLIRRNPASTLKTIGITQIAIRQTKVPTYSPGQRSACLPTSIIQQAGRKPPLQQICLSIQFPVLPQKQVIRCKCS
jgi:hypothetical protein